MVRSLSEVCGELCNPQAELAKRCELTLLLTLDVEVLEGAQRGKGVRIRCARQGRAVNPAPVAFTPS